MFFIVMPIWSAKHLGDKVPERTYALLLFYICCKMRDLPCHVRPIMKAQGQITLVGSH